MPLTHEQKERARLLFKAIYEFRRSYEPCGFKQAYVADVSGIGQPTISKILNGQIQPSEDQLNRLFEGLGLKMDNLLAEWHPKNRLLGYLATPLTGIANQSHESAELERVVGEIRALVKSNEFSDPPVELYWPGEHTHPVRNADVSADMVYRIDRSRASTYDFIVLFCCDRSYGVGQENEIATQAGMPAVRIAPQAISRMLKGSFLMAQEVAITGSLATRITFDPEQLRAALQWARRAVIKQHALFGSAQQNDFGKRLRKLIGDLIGSYDAFASDLGISLSYLHSLMDEPFQMANPSARLLQRMSHRLGVSLSYLLGENQEVDPMYAESVANFSRWFAQTKNLDENVAHETRASWEQEFGLARKEEQIGVSYRAKPAVVKVIDWDKRYQVLSKEGLPKNGHQKPPSLFE